MVLRRNLYFEVLKYKLAKIRKWNEMKLNYRNPSSVSLRFIPYMNGSGRIIFVVTSSQKFHLLWYTVLDISKTILLLLILCTFLSQNGLNIILLRYDWGYVKTKIFPELNSAETNLHGNLLIIFSRWSLFKEQQIVWWLLLFVRILCYNSSF